MKTKKTITEFYNPKLYDEDDLRMTVLLSGGEVIGTTSLETDYEGETWDWLIHEGSYWISVQFNRNGTTRFSCQRTDPETAKRDHECDICWYETLKRMIELDEMDPDEEN